MPAQHRPPVPASAAECIHAEGHRARTIFGLAMKAEAVHAGLCKLALQALEQSGDLAESGFYLCPVYGHVEFGAPPGNCPICGAGQGKLNSVP